MRTDSFFEQGVTHEVCEDYALHGDEYVIVSDGCSNGGGPRIHSDWGSRLLCKAAEQHLHRTDSPNDFAAFVCSTAAAQISSFPNLDANCLTATLMTLLGDGKVLVAGDGVCGGKLKDGSWQISIIEFPPGGETNQPAPYYLLYRMIKFGQQEWAKKFGGICTVKTFIGDLMADECPDDWTFESRDAFWQEQGEWREHSFEWQFGNPFYITDLPTDQYDFTFIASDGPQSFYEMRRTATQKYNERVHVMDALRVLLDLRNFCPGFARLQRNWVFKQDRADTFVRRNWHNGDDVSLGVIYHGEA